MAIYLYKGPGGRCEYEVGRVEVRAGGEFAGKLYGPREAFPPSEAWGRSAWTFTNNSHRDPLAAALAKAEALIGGTERNGEQP